MRAMPILQRTPPARSAEAEHREILRHAFCDDDGARFEELATRMRALTAGRRKTPAEDVQREMRNERCFPPA
jgi:plasmid stability protein